MNIDGKIIDNDDLEIGPKNKRANDIINIEINNNVFKVKRFQLLAETFIKNPHDFKFANLIDPKRVSCSLLNIKWTDRIQWKNEL